MRYLLLALPILLGAAATQPPAPVTLHVGSPHDPSTLYGPADMLCDLYTCRLFNLPEGEGVPKGAIVAFGLPSLDGQGRLDIRRCLQLCRASVLGWPVPGTAAKEHQPQTITITPIELRLE